MWTIHAMCNDNGKLVGNTGKKHICFGSDVIPGFSSSDTHVAFQMD
jgi:hypothetical protein